MGALCLSLILSTACSHDTRNAYRVLTYPALPPLAPFIPLLSPLERAAADEDNAIKILTHPK